MLSEHWSTWALEPAAVAGLALVALLYRRGLSRAGSSRRSLPVAAFTVGWVLLALALLSPLHTVGEVLLSAHMAQHTILLVAPLLLVAGGVGPRSLQGLDPALRGPLVRSLRRLTRPLLRRPVAWAVLAVTVLVWHSPPVFELATDVPVLHAAEHLTLVGSALLYWGSLFGERPHRERSFGAAVASVFALLLVSTAVGALITFSTVPWYPRYATIADQLGVDWLMDQQLAGVLMWVPMGPVLVAVAVWLAVRWLQSADEPLRSESVR